MQTSRLRLEGNSQLRTMQIIAAALVGGVAMFAAITLLMGTWSQPVQPGVLKYAGLLFTFLVLAPAALAPMLIDPSRDHASAGDSAEPSVASLLGVYQTRMIVRLAMLEGAAFLNLVAFLIEHARWSLGLSVLLALAMLALLPTRTRLEHFVETEQTKFGNL